MIFNNFKKTITTYIKQKRLNWIFLMHVFAKYLYKVKMWLETEHFLLKIGFSKPSFLPEHYQLLALDVE